MIQHCQHLYVSLTKGSLTGNAQPFVIYAVNDGNEDKDISNRGFSLSYSQTYCSVV